MKCRRCKKQLRKGAKFCPACGARVEKKRGIRFTSILLVIVLLLSIVAIGWSGGILFAKLFGGKFIDLFSGKENIEIHNVEEAIAHARELGEEYGYENAFSELTEKVTTTVDGDSYYRLQQNYQGIPVYGRTVVYALDEDHQVTSISGNVQDIDIVDLSIGVTDDTVKLSVQQYLNELLSEENIDDVEVNNDNLSIYTFSEDGLPHLVYRVFANGYEILIDAHTGNIVSSKAVIRAETGYLATDVNRTNGFSITQNSEGLYTLEDFELHLSVYNLNGKSGNKFENRQKATPITSADFIFGNTMEENGSEEAVRLYRNISEIKKYITSICGFDCYWLFAFYNDGYKGGKNALGGYAGEIDGEFLGMVSFGRVTGVDDIDAMAHEYGHVISFKTVEWAGDSFENDSINEGISDIFGEIAEAHCNNLSEPNWVMTGDNIDVIRNIHSPNGISNASHIEDSFALGELIEGKEYYYSTVISHAAYLMWNGIDGSETARISAEDIIRIWYRAMLMMPADCDFATCRQMVEWAALAVDGITDEQRACIAEAFDRVGIEDVTLSPEILVDCDRNVRPNSVLNVYNVDGELHPRYTLNITGTVAERELAYASNILSDIGYRYETTEEITKAKSYHLDLPDGYYTFNITDSNNPMYSYTFTVSVSDQGTDGIIELHTDFEDKLVVKVTDPPKSNTYETYISAARKTTEAGNWSEYLTMTANMAITDGSAKTKTKVTLTSDADVFNYSESDPSQIRMSGSAEMTVMGQTYAWDMDYENGTAHYRYTKPNQTSADMKIDPSFFNFGTMTSDMMTDAKLSGNKITFTVPSEKIAEVGIAAVNQMSGVDDLEYGDVDVTVTISNEGKIDNIVMIFHASLEYQGYDADVDYNIDYRFSDSTSISDNPASSSTVPGIYGQDGSDYNTLPKTNSYDDILSMYHASISCNWSNCDNEGSENVGDPDNACYIFSRYESNRSLEEVGYALLDINNDGESELFISMMDIADSGAFYDMYTISNGKLLHVITAGERDRYNIAEDLSINNNGSGSASTGRDANYSLDSTNGKLQVNHFIDYDYNREPHGYYTTVGYFSNETHDVDSTYFEPISKEKSFAILDSFPENVALVLTPFSEYRHPSGDFVNNAGIVATGDCGKDLTWTLHSDGTLAISGSGEMTNYYVGDDNGPPWLDEDVEVESIVFNGDITSIGENAFCYTSIKDITIPVSVSAIQYSALDYIDTLEGVYVDSGNTVYASDDFGVLFNKDKTVLILAPTKLQGTYTVPTSVTWIYDNAFSGCSRLKTINWPDSVNTIGQGAFSGCTSLEYICIPSCVTVLDHYVFNDCSNLSGIRISENITSIGYLAFGNCNIKDVFYGGDERQWQQLMENCQDENLLEAKVYYNSY